MQMCIENDVCSIHQKANEYKPKAVVNFLSVGLATLKKQAIAKGQPLNKLRPCAIVEWDEGIQDLQIDEDGEVSSAGDDEPEVGSDEDDTSSEGSNRSTSGGSSSQDE
jgi:hypothetical protein